MEQNKYEESLEQDLLSLKECQIAKGVESCFKCDEILGCEVRNKYVDSVYSSMNKGSGGFFEFETEG